MIQCKACQGMVKSILASRTRAGIRRELNSIWDIKPEIIDLGSNSVVHGGKCKNCGSMNFNGEQGNKAFYDACYKSEKYSRNSPWDYHLQLEAILESVETLKVLDFGGGISPFATEIASQIDLTVIDLSPKVHEELKSLNIKTYFDLSEIPKGLKFNHVNISHTIEHVDNPIHLVESLVELLNPHGKIYVTTPDANYPYLLSSPLDWPPHHTIEFSPKAILMILKSAGLKNFQIFRNPNQGESAFDFMVCGEL
jgi:2-polyprenyl-3-methyl-5-hydroxy-6-metoxy-1,4-benzoquinol methylase